MEQYIPEDGQNEALGSAVGSTATPPQEQANIRETATEKAMEVKERMIEQASTVKEKLGTQLGQQIDNARGKTSQGLRSTSQRIDRLAMYLEGHDSRDMSEALSRTSQEMVRKHPGRSVLVGILVGILLGRIFR